MTRKTRWRLLVVALLTPCVGCEAPVASDLAEAQANRIVVALDARGIGASKERQAGTSDEPAFQVNVPASDVARALTVLRAVDLPRPAERGFAEIFGEPSLVPTATEERVRYVAALDGELAASIEQIEGVLDSRVHVALPERRDFDLDEEPPSPGASVLVKYAPGPPPYDEAAIRELVAGAVHGMQPENVVVVGVVGLPPPAAAPRLAWIGPIAVSRGSAGLLKGVLGASLLLHLVLAALLVIVMTRRRRDGTPAGEPRASDG